MVVDLLLIFEISSLRTSYLSLIFELVFFFCLFQTAFLQATQAVKIKFEIDKKSSSKINFMNQRFQKSSADGQGVSTDSTDIVACFLGFHKPIYMAAIHEIRWYFPSMTKAILQQVHFLQLVGQKHGHLFLDFHQKN